MKQTSKDISLQAAKKALGLPLSVINEWNKIAREFESLGLKIVEFMPTEKANYRWGLIAEPNSNSEKKKSDYFNKRVNSELKSSFVSNTKLPTKHWENLFTEVNFPGFYIPIHDLKYVDLTKLKSHVDFYQLLLNHFSYKTFFKELHENLVLLRAKEDKLPHVIWFYLIHYTIFLLNLKNNFYSQYVLFDNWFTEQLDLNDFHQRLPSEQATILLLNRCESIVNGTDELWHKQRIYSKAIPEVVAFFQKFENNFAIVFNERGDQSEREKIRNNMRVEFVSLFSYDKEQLFIQEALDNKSKIGLVGALSLMDQLKYGPKSLYNVSGVIKDKVFSNKQRAAGEFKEHDENLPKYLGLRHRVYPEGVQYWYDLTINEKEEIVETINQNSSLQLIEEGNQAAASRSTANLLNLINLISAPVLVWNKDGRDLYPQWNLFKDLDAKIFQQKYKLSKVGKAKERKLLAQHLKALYSFGSFDEITKYINEKNPIFTHEEFHNKWETELNRFKRRIIQKEKFYERKMKEFGIFESNFNKKVKTIWVEEMLAIEEEVKPYINFVKQAFQTALPIRKNVTFSDFRHSNDGVEFDADTLYDQEKWIRANVMKVMESNIERGNAIQINTFCLDYSGSMAHDRMRNLFKILYLLVLGLEDRKSFDSFHFFSNKFIEVVNFSDAFTNRKVLFKIMQQISKLHMGKVYFEGLGGTNISEGIGVSHEKMTKFVNEFKENNPLANIVTSMFVITDGEPSLGITEIPALAEFIESKRKEGDVEIKGIFIKSEDDISLDMMADIFGKDNYVETADFKEAVNKFVKIMTETYKEQRKAFKWKQKKQKLGLTK